MYIPAFTAIDEPEARAIVTHARSGWLVTTGPSPDNPPVATLMPILWRGDRVLAHLARANPHWRAITDDTPGLFIVTGPEAYISPSWYPTKAEHGRVVPTWNYQAVHLTGPLRTHHDPDWLHTLVSQLTNQHESHRPDPWHITDAPDDYIARQLRAIVGIEMLVHDVQGKAKLSQNRSASDRHGVVAGLRQHPDQPGDRHIADLIDELPTDHDTD